MSNYADYDESIPCPYCQTPCNADFCDVGVGMIQCGPYHCMSCFASEIGPYDNKFAPGKHNLDNNGKLLTEPPDGARILTPREIETGWYAPNTPAGDTANVIGGRVVSHKEMLEVYREEFTDNPAYYEEGVVEQWWEDIRKRPDDDGDGL